MSRARCEAACRQPPFIFHLPMHPLAKNDYYTFADNHPSALVGGCSTQVCTGGRICPGHGVKQLADDLHLPRCCTCPPAQCYFPLSDSPQAASASLPVPEPCAVVQPVCGWLVVFHCSNERIRTGFGTSMSTLVLEDPQLLPLRHLSPNSDSSRAELSGQSLETLTFMSAFLLMSDRNVSASPLMLKHTSCLC